MRGRLCAAWRRERRRPRSVGSVEAALLAHPESLLRSSLPSAGGPAAGLGSPRGRPQPCPRAGSPRFYPSLGAARGAPSAVPGGEATVQGRQRAPCTPAAWCPPRWTCCDGTGPAPEHLGASRRGEGASTGRRPGSWHAPWCPARSRVRWVVQLSQGLLLLWRVRLLPAARWIPCAQRGLGSPAVAARTDRGPVNASKVVESLRRELAVKNACYDVR